MNDHTTTRYRCILADPPWRQTMTGKRSRSKGGVAESLPYQTMSLEAIKSLTVSKFADTGTHLWLWTTNEFLRDGFEVMDAWGFKYLAPIHWVKPSGIGNWFVHRSQTLLFGYKRLCKFPLKRYQPNIIISGDPVRHSAKPEAAYSYIESISPGPRLELFARQKREGWDVWGNEVNSDIVITTEAA
jgi:N6-adenosine-specific RNA methylase IME4